MAQLWHRYPAVWLGLALVCAAGPQAARGQSAFAPVVTAVEDLSGGFGPVAGPRVASMHAGRLAVAWTVEDGPAQGVYLRRRDNFLWEAAPQKIAATDAGAPRDLALLYDRRGAIHLFWTQATARGRRVLAATLGAAPGAELPRELPCSGAGDADYPAVAYRFDEDRFIAAWQTSQATSQFIEACAIDAATGAAAALPSPSGAIRSAMSPQILPGPLPLVAFYVVLESDNDLRAVELSEAGAWNPAGIPGVDSALPYRNQPLLAGLEGAAPFACWHDEAGEAGSAIVVARREASAGGALASARFDAPAGDHRMPQIVVESGVAFTLCWRTFAADRQSVQLSQFNWTTKDKTLVALSPETHRFASEPFHETKSPYTFAVWTDDARAGGTGALGFAEVRWGGHMDAERFRAILPAPSAP